jgi:LysR family transcriptional regulator, nitrogen assimilation regulatory protein
VALRGLDVVLGLRGAAAGILPYGTVRAEARDGSLGVRPIVAPTLRRTLYLATGASRGALGGELALTGVVHEALRGLARAMGPLGHPLLPPEG